MNHLLKIIVPAATLLMTSLAACTTKNSLSTTTDEAIDYCHGKVVRSLQHLAAGGDNYTLMPRNIEGHDTIWNCRPAVAEEWCSGFWPGVLWLDYENSHDQAVLNKARNYTDALGYMAHQPVFDHDLGFIMLCSYGNGYRLTHNPDYKAILLEAADSLATLYNPAVGTLLSWPRNVEMFGGHNTIMDNMINLELLFWAADNGADTRLRDIAVNHAATTMRNHFRPDGTCFHVAVYDPVSGKFLRGVTHQGYSDSSTWARGQAWAVYGYTMVYRETQQTRFLDFACKVADAFLNRLPEDNIPYWDFDDPDIPNTTRDASAAAVVASALVELQQYCTPQLSQRYLDSARSIMASLATDRYRSAPNKDSFLDHSTGHRPAGSEIDASIIYADYYYSEALNRLKKIEQNEAQNPAGTNLAFIGGCLR